jgi:hypothetical protein
MHCLRLYTMTVTRTQKQGVESPGMSPVRRRVVGQKGPDADASRFIPVQEQVALQLEVSEKARR